MNTEQMRARWYSVDATGMATLCRDEADAIKTAADNSIMWPNLAPHKAVQLIEARAALTHPQEPARVGGVPTLSKDQIREVFLSHGFTIKEGQTDLKPYVYDAADALLKLADAALAAQPAEGGEAAHIEVVGKVVEREDGNEVLWSIEGGIEAIPAGMVLLISDRPVTDDNGHGEVYTTPTASQELLLKLAAIAAECSDQDTTDALDQLIAATPASQDQAQQPSTQAWANETGLRQIECPSCGDLAVAYDPQQPSGEVVAVPDTETLRKIVTRHALQIDEGATLEDFPDALDFQIEMARALLREFGLTASTSPKAEPVPYVGWYCAQCQRGVDSSEVTYHEQHTVCGRVIADDVPPATQAELEAEVERLRKPLTPEQVWQLWAEVCKPERPTVELVEAFARAIEAAKDTP